MKIRTCLASVACAAFVAATLQGSRLPDESANHDAAVALAGATAYRAGPGAEKDEYPPRSDTAIA